jgi:hypothetical protein
VSSFVDLDPIDYTVIADVLRHTISNDEENPKLNIKLLRAILERIELHLSPLPAEVARILTLTTQSAKKPVPLGAWLEAKAGGSLNSYLLQGWSKLPESWGCWSEGPIASFSVIVRTLCRTDLIAEFLVNGFVDDEIQQQSVRVKVNGEERAIWVFTDRIKPTSYILEIPARGFLFGTRSAALTFEFEISSPKSPFSTGMSEDRRALGLGLLAVMLSAATKPAEVIGLGIPMEACEDGALTPCFQNGWSKPERWGCWSVGQWASLCIPIKIPAGRLRIEAIARVFTKDIRKDVIVWINERIVGTWSFLRGDFSYQQATIDVKDTAPSLNILFQTKNPEMPSAEGTSSDNRPLALGLRSLMVTVKEEVPGVDRPV